MHIIYIEWKSRKCVDFAPFTDPEHKRHNLHALGNENDYGIVCHRSSCYVS